eukprot:scaffold34597_cov177-Amphora_coffeaeformis.AAC.36
MKWMIFLFACLAPLNVVARFSPSPGYRMWSFDSLGASSVNGTQRTLVNVNHESFVSFVNNRAGELPYTLLFPSVLGETLECDVVPAFLAPGLLEKYPSLVSWTGLCKGRSSVSLTYNLNVPGSLSTTFFKDGQVVRVELDKKSSDAALYTIRRYADSEVSPDFQFITKEPPKFNDEAALFSNFLSGGRHLDQALTGLPVPPNVDKAYKFRIAFLVTDNFVAKLQAQGYATATKVDVIGYLSEILARLNGIFMRELGVFFELIADSEKLICLSNVPAGCGNWAPAGTTTSGNLLDRVGEIIEDEGVLSTDYEISHALYDVNNQFGVAWMGAVCRGNVTLRSGVSGVGTLNIDLKSDSFVVDLFAHEVGHQLLGSHTFDFCPDNPNYEDGFNFGPYSIPATAYEPGSGVTIMSYTGICGANGDVQQDSDPYFHSTSLLQMRAFVERQVNFAGCPNETIAISIAKPTLQVEVPDQNGTPTCTVPVGNFVQLTGQVLNPDNTATYYYTWERFDSQENTNYQVRANPRFMTQTPRADQPIRYLPNLYLATYPNVLASQLEEIFPESPVTMDFRFTARSQYSFSGGLDPTDFLGSTAGTFGYTDIALDYVSTIDRLTITIPPTTVTSNTDVTLTWTGGNPSANVEILIARNTMVGENNEYEYDTDVDFLDFILIAEVANDGQETVTIPDFENTPEVP